MADLMAEEDREIAALQGELAELRGLVSQLMEAQARPQMRGGACERVARLDR